MFPGRKGCKLNVYTTEIEHKIYWFFSLEQIYLSFEIQVISVYEWVSIYSLSPSRIASCSVCAPHLMWDIAGV